MCVQSIILLFQLLRWVNGMTCGYVPVICATSQIARPVRHRVPTIPTQELALRDIVTLPNSAGLEVEKPGSTFLSPLGNALAAMLRSAFSDRVDYDSSIAAKVTCGICCCDQTQDPL